MRLDRVLQIVCTSKMEFLPGASIETGMKHFAMKDMGKSIAIVTRLLQ